MNIQEIRQAVDNVSIEGWLYDMKLTNTGDVIRGSITITTGQNEYHELSVYQARFAKADTRREKQLEGYNSMQQLMAAPTLAGLMKSGMSRDDALTRTTTLRVLGSLQRNDYFSTRLGSMQSRDQIRAGRIYFQTAVSFKPHATFEVEAFFTKISEETDHNGVRTGRVVCDTVIPGFNGIVYPITFYVEAGEGATYVLEHYRVNQTALFRGDIINTTVEVQQKATGFGTPGRGKTTKISEYRITGAELPYEEGAQNAYTVEEIKEMLAYRENVYLPSKQNRQSAAPQGAPNPFVTPAYSAPQYGSVTVPTAPIYTQPTTATPIPSQAPTTGAPNFNW